MNALIGELKVPAVIAVVLAATLGYAWARGVESAAAVRSWPAADPALMKRVLEMPDVETSVSLQVESKIPAENF